MFESRIQCLENQTRDSDAKLFDLQAEREQLHLSLAEKTAQINISLETIGSIRKHNKEATNEKLIELTAQISIEKVSSIFFACTNDSFYFEK